jgi:hypothetical protein
MRKLHPDRSHLGVFTEGRGLGKLILVLGRLHNDNLELHARWQELAKDGNHYPKKYDLAMQLDSLDSLPLWHIEAPSLLHQVCQVLVPLRTVHDDLKNL